MEYVGSFLWFALLPLVLYPECGGAARHDVVVLSAWRQSSVFRRSIAGSLPSKATAQDSNSKRQPPQRKSKQAFAVSALQFLIGEFRHHLLLACRRAIWPTRQATIRTSSTKSSAHFVSSESWQNGPCAESPYAYCRGSVARVRDLSATADAECASGRSMFRPI